MQNYKIFDKIKNKNFKKRNEISIKTKIEILHDLDYKFKSN